MKEASENCFIHDRVLVCGQDIGQRKRGVVREPVDGVKLEIMIIYRVAFEKPQNILQHCIFIKTKFKGNKF